MYCVLGVLGIVSRSLDLPRPLARPGLRDAVSYAPLSLCFPSFRVRDGSRVPPWFFEENGDFFFSSRSENLRSVPVDVSRSRLVERSPTKDVLVEGTWHLGTPPTKSPKGPFSVPVAVLYYCSDRLGKGVCMLTGGGRFATRSILERF